jgi:ParB family chromosome partitioning protein
MAMPDDGRSRLGRGLAALIGDVGEEVKAEARGRSQRRVPIEFLKQNARNPRRSFSEAELDELAASIKERGIIQPIVVRPLRGFADSFEIIAGERRWRAAQIAGLHQVPIVVIEATDEEALQYAIIENVQRADLNPLEEAAGYQALVNDFAHSHDDVAKIVGKSRAHITNMLRLLKLSDNVQSLIRSGELTAGHARVLIGQPNAESLARQIVERALNVRQAEALTRQNGKARTKKSTAHAKNPDTAALEKRLSDALGLKVAIDDRDGNGTVRIDYETLEQLDCVVSLLTRQ